MGVELSSEDECEAKEVKRAEGYRFVDMGGLKDLIQIAQISYSPSNN